MSSLTTQGLVKQFGRTTVVDNVDITVSGGEVVGLLGPNGAGKTTCFYMICGLVRRDQGTILLDGKDISGLPMHQRARKGIGYLPQEPSIFRRLTVRDNLLAVLEAVPDLDPNVRQQRADEMLERFGITHKASDYGYSLSGGERRRVEIARAIALRPSFMLLDEPFAGIDPISIIDIQKLIQDLKEMQIGVLITDHNVRETLGICDRAYILTQGKVLTEGSAEHILAHDEVRSVYLGTGFRL
tara:strand:+ start:203 stop:928 length:726 start_codon:yes stop_codon:yes gene_type:complete